MGANFHLSEDLVRRVKPRDPRRYMEGIRPKFSLKRYTAQMVGFINKIGSLDLTKPVRVAGNWLEPPVDTRRHHMHLGIAERGGGKSVTIAKIAELYKEGPMEPVIMDLIDGGSGENLCWCIKAANCPVCGARVSPILKECPGVKPDATECRADLPGVPEGKYPVLLVIPDGMRFSAPDWADVTPVPASEANLADLLSLAKRRGKVVVFGWSFFRGRNKETALSLLTDWCLAIDDATDAVDVDAVVVIREAATYLFSRIKTWRAENEFKPQVLRLIREARHQSRSCIVLDSQRWTDVDSAIRTRSDRIWLGVQPASQIMKEGLDWAIYDIQRRQGKAGRVNRFFAYEAFPNIGFLLPHQKYCLWPAREELLLISPFPMPKFHTRMEQEFPKHFGFQYSLAGVGLDLGPETAAPGGAQAVPAPGATGAPAREYPALTPELMERIVAEAQRDLLLGDPDQQRPGILIPLLRPAARRTNSLTDSELGVLNILLDHGCSQRDILRAYHFSPMTTSIIARQRRAQVQVGTARGMRSGQAGQGQAGQGGQAEAAAGGQPGEGGEAGEAGRDERGAGEHGDEESGA